MEILKQYNHEEFGKITVSLYNNKPWFLVNDVCKILGYPNYTDTINQHCIKDGVVRLKWKNKNGVSELRKYINEANLFRLIDESQMPKAKEFQQWIEKEVIPDIKKTGKFQSSEDAPSQERLELIEERLKSIIKSNRKYSEYIVEAIGQYSEYIIERLEAVEQHSEYNGERLEAMEERLKAIEQYSEYNIKMFNSIKKYLREVNNTVNENFDVLNKLVHIVTSQFKYIKRFLQKLSTITGPPGQLGVREFARLVNVRLALGEASQLGKLASRATRDMDKKVGIRLCWRWGLVYTYPLKALEIAFHSLDSVREKLQKTGKSFSLKDFENFKD